MHTAEPAANAAPTVLTYEQALETALKYFQGEELPAQVWVNKYALRDADGNYLEGSPAEMHKRMLDELMRIEEKYPNPMDPTSLWSRLANFYEIVPQGSPMAGIGNNHQILSLSNCFVIGHESHVDSYGGIMMMDEEQVHLMKRRGGVGQDLSQIRPADSPVNNAARTSTGVVPLMERHSNSTREVAQNGRRGALMLSLDVRHPDAEGFIDAKVDTTKVTGANISVRITDKFMEAVRANASFTQQYPIDADNPDVTKEVDARTLFNKIVKNAHASAEPGILFWDSIIGQSTPDQYEGFQTTSTNPCGEIPLTPYDSCRLTAMNLLSFVEDPFTEDAVFRFDRFRKSVYAAMRVMDNIVDLEIEKIDAILAKIDSDPEPDHVKYRERNLWTKIRNKAIRGRRTGLGLTAAGDTLAALGFRYGSKEATDMMSLIVKTMAVSAMESSIDMAEERGAFEAFFLQRDMESKYIQRMLPELSDEHQEKYMKYGRRNIAALTIAPTGSVSVLTQTTSGLENMFMPFYTRRRKINPSDENARVDFTDEVGDSWQEYQMVEKTFRKYLNIRYGLNDEQIMNTSPDLLQTYFEESPYYKATSNDVDWVEKVRMQGEVQKWIDHSISVTVNLPNDIDEETVGKVYMEAWEAGCKGITVYRDGSRTGVLVTDTSTEEEEQPYEHHAPKRPETLPASVVRFHNGTEEWVAVVGLYEDKPYEIFTGPLSEGFASLRWVTQGNIVKTRLEDGSSRYDFNYTDQQGFKTIIEGLSRVFNPDYWNYAKLISGILRHGMPLPHVLDLVSGLNLGEQSLHNWKAGVTRALKQFIADGTQASGKLCQNCSGGNLIYQEGCVTCKDCGSSKCG